MKNWPAAIIVITVLAGCGGPDPGDVSAADEDEASGDHQHLLDAARQPLDRARQVEDASATRKSQLDQELDAAGAQ